MHPDRQDPGPKFQYKTYDQTLDFNHVSSMIYGQWNVVYSWPPPEEVSKLPPVMIFESPTKLQTVMYNCRCDDRNIDYFAPVKTTFKSICQIRACQIVNSEEEVLPALNYTQCPCGGLPLHTKFVILPLNEDYLIFYTIWDDISYSIEMQNTAYLLHKDQPSVEEIEFQIKGFDIERRAGGLAFKII